MAVVGTEIKPLWRPDMPSSRWILRTEPNESAKLRLICIPHAGGSGIIYRTWPQDLPDFIEVCAIELPGRGRRIGEKPFTSLKLLVNTLLESILPEIDRPYALFGHSFGALVSYELARGMQTRHGLPPVHLCVSGAKAPQFISNGSAIHTQPDPVLINYVRNLGGTSEIVLQNEEMISAVLPALRADLEMSETYNLSKSTQFDNPILVLAGNADPKVDRGSLEAWAEHTTAGFQMKFFPGNHFYFYETQAQVLRFLGQALEQSLSLLEDI
jgi:medium-chain acyl-[acyl-carrier-protein] hydrolase